MSEWRRSRNGKMREVAVFGPGGGVGFWGSESLAFDVTDDWPPMPELSALPQWCVCGNRLTPEGRCSVGYTKHRDAITKAHAA